MAAQTPNPEKKTMTSRLLSMKFMQRGIASSASSPTTPTKDESDRSAKRRKSSHVVTPGEIASPVIDQKAVQAAIEEEERNYQATIKKQAEEAGDAHWVLPGPFPLPSNGKPLEAGLKVRYLSQAQIDNESSGEEEDDEQKVWRKKPVFRRYNMPERKPVKAATASDGESDSDDSDGSEPMHSPRSGKRASVDQHLKRKRSSSEFSARRKAENEKAHQFAEKRRKKDVKLNKSASTASIQGLTSISGAGGGSSAMKCYNCNKPGHRAVECPSKGSKSSRR